MKQSRAPQFEFLRFIAFTLIFIWHANLWQLDFLPNDKGAAAGVSFFFILSGFLTGYSSYHKGTSKKKVREEGDRERRICEDGIREGGTCEELTCKEETRKCGTCEGGNRYSVKGNLQYVFQKLKRFYPLYLITGLIFLIYTDIPANVAVRNFSGCRNTVVRFAKYVFMLQSWFNNGEYFAFNRAGWFISSILPAYLLAYPAKCLARRILRRDCEDFPDRGNRPDSGNLRNSSRIFAFVFLCITALTVLYCFLTRNLNGEFYRYVFPIARLGEFFSGMALGYLIFPIRKRIQENGGGTAGVPSGMHLTGEETFPTGSGILSGAGIPSRTLFTAAELLSLLIWGISWYLPMPGWCSHIAGWLLPGFLVVAVFGIGAGSITRLFSGKIFTRLGKLTFPAFLLNPLVIQIYYSSVGDISCSTGLGKCFSLAFTFCITLLLSAVTDSAE